MLCLFVCFVFVVVFFSIFGHSVAVPVVVADLATERECHLTTGRRAVRTKLDLDGAQFAAVQLVKPVV